MREDEEVLTMLLLLTMLSLQLHEALITDIS